MEMDVRKDKLLLDIFGHQYYLITHGDIFNKYNGILSLCCDELNRFQNLSKFGHDTFRLLIGDSYTVDLNNYYNKDFKRYNPLINQEILEKWRILPWEDFVEDMKRKRIEFDNNIGHSIR